MKNPFGDAGDAHCMARNPLDEQDSMSMRGLLATRPEFFDLSRMSDAQVRRHVAELQAMGRLPVLQESAPVWARTSIPSEAPQSLAPTVLAAVVRSQEKRYPLLVALTYHPPQAVCPGKVLPARFKWESEVTGPETRRSGEIKSGDPVFTELRRREMPEGNYRLEFQNAALDACAIKPTRS